MIGKRVEETQSPPLVALGQLAAQHDCISLGQGAPYYYPPSWVFDSLKQRLGDSDVHRYTSDPGLVEVRESIARKLQSDQGINVDASQLVLTPGANQAFYNILLTLTDPGDEVIIFSPYYFNHHMACTSINVVPVVVPLSSDFRFDFDRMRAAITPRTKIVVLVNPGNPTGIVHDRGELQGLVDICAEHKLILIADETYEYFTYGKEHLPLSTLGYDNIIGLGSFSKTFGIPGWRLGYYYGEQEMIDASIKVQDTIGICAPHPTQLLGQVLLEHRDDIIPGFVSEMETNHKLGRKLLDEISWLEATPSQGAYYLFPRQTTGRDTMNLVKELITQYGVYVVPGEGFGQDWKEYCRISFANVRPHQLEEAFDRLSSY